MTKQNFIESPVVYEFIQYSGTFETFVTDMDADWGLRVLEDPDVPGRALVIVGSTLVTVNPTDWFGHGNQGFPEVKPDAAMQGYNQSYTAAPPPE